MHDRVLTVSGALDGIAKAYGIVAKSLLEGAPTMGMGGVVTANGTHRKFIEVPKAYGPHSLFHSFGLLLSASRRLTDTISP